MRGTASCSRTYNRKDLLTMDRIFKSATIEELREINKQVVTILRSKQIEGDAVAIRKFHIGQKVSFIGRRGRRMHGVVRGIRRTSIRVDCKPLFGTVPETWSVRASALTIEK